VQNLRHRPIVAFVVNPERSYPVAKWHMDRHKSVTANLCTMILSYNRRDAASGCPVPPEANRYEFDRLVLWAQVLWDIRIACRTECLHQRQQNFSSSSSDEVITDVQWRN